MTQLCEPKPLDPIWPHAASPPPTLTEPLSDHMVSSPPHPCSQLLDYLPEQAEVIEDANIDNDNEDEDRRQPQQDMGEDATAALMSRKVGKTSLTSEMDEGRSGEDELGSHGDSYSDDELNDTESNDEDGASRPVQRKRTRPSSSNHGPSQKKQRASHNNSASKKRQHRPRQTPRHKYQADSSSNRHLPNSQPRLDQSSRFPAAPYGIAQLPSALSSTSGNNISELTYGGFSGDVQPTLIKITFRLYPPHCCSFAAVIREGCEGQGVSFSQLTRLFERIGHVGQINDFTFTMARSRSFLITGFTQHPSSSSQSSCSRETVSTAEVGLIHRNKKCTRLQDGRAVDARSLAPQSEPSSSSDNSGLSDSHPESNSDDSGSSGDELDCSNTVKNAQWEDLDELRLLTYKEAGKRWDWIFKKFPVRTQNAVRSRLTIAKRKHRPRTGSRDL